MHRPPIHFLPLAPRDLLILTAMRSQSLHGYGLVKEAERLSEGKVRMDPARPTSIGLCIACCETAWSSSVTSRTSTIPDDASTR